VSVSECVGVGLCVCVLCMCVHRLEAEVSELKKCLEKSHCDAEHMRCVQLQVSLARALSLCLCF